MLAARYLHQQCVVSMLPIFVQQGRSMWVAPRVRTVLCAQTVGLHGIAGRTGLSQHGAMRQ